MVRSLTVLASLFVLSAVHAEDWSQFRGPNGDGRADRRQPPVAWGDSKNIAWKTALPGRGWSSPVTDGQRIWVTAAIEHPLTEEQKEAARKEKLADNPLANQMDVVGSVSLHWQEIDATSGKLLHDQELFSVNNPAAIHSLNSYASPTPILDRGRLFCHFGTMGTASVDVETGKVLWKTRLPEEHSVGPGGSPVVWGELLIVQCDGTESQSVVGLDVRTGEEVWRTKRPPMEGDKGDLHKAFCTPLLIRVGDRDQLVGLGAQWVVAYDPATGTEIWKVRHGSGFSNVSRPVYSDGIVFICTGYMKPELVAIRADGQGDVTESHVLWRMKRQVPAMPSPIVVDDLVYIVSDAGIATCVEAATGKEVWQERIGGNYSASPLFANGRIYISSREGTTTVFRTGREFVSENANTLEGQLMASPALIGNDLILRSATHLYRISSGPEAKVSAR